MSALTRKLVLVDLENLAGCSPLDATPEHYASAFAALSGAVTFRSTDLIVIGVNPRLAFVAHDIAPSARLVTRRGPDGAESRLIEEVSEVAFVAARFPEVVIASGDGAFTDAVVPLNAVNVTTTVVSLPDQLATSLRLAARTVVLLPRPLSAGEAA